MTHTEILGVLADAWANAPADATVIEILQRGSLELERALDKNDNTSTSNIPTDPSSTKKPENLGGGAIEKPKKEPKVAPMKKMIVLPDGETMIPNLSPREQKL